MRPSVTLRAARERLRLGQRLMRLEDRRFDARVGIDVKGVAEPTGLTVVAGDPECGFTYVATPVRVARWWLGALPGRASDFTLIDMGSGKGRVLALAAAHGFARVVGVEFAVELHRAATRNADAARRRSVVFEPVLADATTFAFPREPLVVHFNNPFAEPVMECVLRNLARSYADGPRPVVVVYQQLADEDAGQRTSNLELLADAEFLSARELDPRGWVDRRLLAPYLVRLFESPEALALTATR